ncbi:MAG: hypothetical protein ACI82A_000802 [Candidatus Azotimanducaceae bacterium]|jgi:hypothetical protein
MSGMWASIAVIAIVAIISKAVVSITSGRGNRRHTKGLEQDIVTLENDLEDAIQRIIVLEKIVTDGKHTLRREIDDLAG